MKLSALSLGLLSLAVTFVNGQYFSDGWSPGQPVTTAQDAPVANPTDIPRRPPAASNNQQAPFKLSSLLDVNTLLSSPPAVSLFSKFGINITERLEGAVQATKFWDERVPLITDHNYQDLIVNESLTEQEENDRTWVIVISVTAGKQDGISKYVDQVFDAAFNATIVAGDLPNIRWGRIDYFNVTGITTKWSVWHAPYLVILRNRGQSLRFYRPHQLRMNSEAMRKFLQHDDWRHTPAWSSIYGPGGEREYVLNFLAVVFTKFYDTMIMIPRWMMFILSGGIASVMINLLHKPGAAATAAPPARQQQPSPPSTATTPAPASAPVSESTSTATNSSPSKANKRKKANRKS
ncbi:hypothetical protein H0H81_001639 [Sphagnurus paluster]|uniref:Uncharacterized protein n=1 Tax=Sphagnurus paluster TaxID=117069 RepID=A0A9P7K458_9AGAR|nr:hypothetical protein H0H81_001639 [Sphagnurus paluster]